MAPRETAPLAVPAGKKRWPAWLLAMFVLGVLGATLALGRTLLKPRTATTDTDDRPAGERTLRVEDIDTQFEFVPGGVASVGEQVEVIRTREPTKAEFFREVINDLRVERGVEDVRALLERPTVLAGSWPEVFSIAMQSYLGLVDSLQETRTLTVPIRARDFYLLRQEVTRGQYGAFVHVMHTAPTTFRARDWIKRLWSPQGSDAKEYAKDYAVAWWQALKDHWQREGITNPLTEDRALANGVSESLLRQPLSLQAAAWLVTPIQWVQADEQGQLSYAIPEGSEDFPVTGISWWDANIFAEWVRQHTKNPHIRLPNEAEFNLAFHGGLALDNLEEEETRRWPWGLDDDVRGCNNLNYGELTGHVGLDSVPREVARHQLFGAGARRTAIVSLAGNAAEWVGTADYVPRTDREEGPYYLAQDDQLDLRVHYKTSAVPAELERAYHAGGSFRDGVDDCAYGGANGSWPTSDKRSRLGHVGFRLAMSTTPFGTGR